MTVKNLKKGKTRTSKPTRKKPGTWGILVDGHEIYRDVEKTCNLLDKDEIIAIDTETTGLSPWRDEIAIIQLHGHDTGTTAIIQTPNGVIPEKIKCLLKSKNKKFVVHNGVGFDLMFFHNANVQWRESSWHDTLVGETLLASTGRKDISKSLRESVRRRLGIAIDKDIEHGQWTKKELSPRQIEYASQDVLYLTDLYVEQITKAKETNQDEAMQMEQDLMPIVAQMTINGLPCRRDRVEKYVENQRAKIAETEKKLLKLFGNINLRSTQQLQVALGKLGIEVDSTSKATLIPISQFGGKAGEIVDDLLFWKGGDQRIKMYSKTWMDEYIIDDYIHPHWWQCSADTTRFTCSNPNLQQIPKDSRGDIIGGIRGLKIINADYSQIEVRIAGYLAGDKVLMRLLEKGDVHTAVASAVFSVTEKQVTPRQRKLAKAMTFLLLFGGGAQGFYEYVKMSGGEITYDEAVNYVHRFFVTFEGLRRSREHAEYLSRKQGPVFIRLPNGSRRILVGWKKKSTTILNTIVQGTASVGIKHGILEADRRGLGNYLSGQIHDELIGVTPTKEAQEYGKELKESMIVGMKKVLPATVKVEVKSGLVLQP